MARWIIQRVGPTADQAPETTTDNRDTSASPYQSAAENIRSAARWLVTAFAAVGGVLVAGVPLTDLGEITPWSGAFVAAAGGVVAALLAIAYMIFVVSRVFTAEFISFADFAGSDIPGGESSPRRRMLIREIAKTAERSGAELYGGEARDLGELYERLNAANELLRKETSAERPPTPAVSARAASVREAASRVVDFVNYEYVRRTFRGLYPRLVVGGVIVVVGVGVYVFKTGQAAPRPLAVTSPLPVQLTLNPSARSWSSLLGPGCVLSSVKAVAVGGLLTTPEVVTEQIGGCRAVRLTLGAQDGVAVPIVKPPS